QPRFVARVDVAARSATPALAACHELELDCALGTERDGHFTVEPLGRRGHEDPDTAPEGSLHLRPAHDLREMRRTDLFLSFSHEHKVYGELPAHAANGVERGEECRFRTLLVHGTAPYERLSEPRLFNQRGFPGRRGPLCRFCLLHVVHEVQAQAAGSAGIDGGEDARLAIRG